MTTTNIPPEMPEHSESAENAIELRATAGKSQGQIVRERFFKHRGAITSLIVLGVIIVFAFSSVGFGPVPGWWKFAPNELSPSLPGGKPTLVMPWSGEFTIGDHPFGQDEVGRDIFARTMKGVQTSIFIIVVMGIVFSLMGTFIGALAGFFRGGIDNVLMRFTDLVITLPALVVGAMLGKLFGAASPLALAVALGAISWPPLGRLVRGDFLSLREREFVDAARVAGASSKRIIFKHMLPNAMGVIIVAVTLLMSQAVILETSLSYLGFGVREPSVSLGMMIANYESAFSTRPWLFWWPGVFIIAQVLCINFIGDGLRDAFDPRQKRVPSARKRRRSVAHTEPVEQAEG